MGLNTGALPEEGRIAARRRVRKRAAGFEIKDGVL